MNQSSLPFPVIRTGLGKNCRRFLTTESSKECRIAGISFDDTPGFVGNSDSDPVFHALCSAIESLTGESILGKEGLFNKSGITDSRLYLQHAIKTLGKQQISHVAISLEGKRPIYKEKLYDMRQNVAKIMQLDLTQVGITAISGSGLSDYGCGDGIQCLCIVTTIEVR